MTARAGNEVMMNDAKFLRAPTIMKAFHDAGAKVAVVTAKDKLRALLGKGLDMSSGRAIAFSSEKADKATLQDNGIDDVLALRRHAAAGGLFRRALGVRLGGRRRRSCKSDRPDLMYLSTTDYMQHKAAPGSEVANAFYAMMDRYVGELDAAGCVLVLTADHGMNDKHLPNGEPDVIYLQDLFDDWLGEGKARVILPITDPYVVHHGALGSFATVYLPDGADVDGAARQARARSRASSWRSRATEACERFELPADRIGDIVVVSTIHKVLGTSARAARPVRPDRAAALAWRPDRADRADDRQPQGRRWCRGSSCAISMSSTWR